MVVLTKPSHKVFLFKHFHVEQFGQVSERRFKLDVLADAASALRKIKAGASEKPGPDGANMISFDDSPAEFTVGEASVLKGILGEIKEASPSEAEAIAELNEIFK